ncbi:hypothetical protein PPL_00819 [Heterostelium album PN500]|uniref:Fibronectin type-III domain-containing protein n=1 Tax=Heterostelium pallidum (strain ATCC 26659 / Pp 5 / PN500) TaxID=670386 RepID=D3AXI8_HETP5|nr:hypothetical protein PPL_00819 [Heterostelium album PN500]EFA86257.1 hypothetical protein PPL_00819 [Heterostelium album PN500]|eukprot:XP_020438362.1 hypothetical protein PPL_00819 [Heterostelium album PN500]
MNPSNGLYFIQKINVPIKSFSFFEPAYISQEDVQSFLCKIWRNSLIQEIECGSLYEIDIPSDSTRSLRAISITLYDLGLPKTVLQHFQQCTLLTKVKFTMLGTRFDILPVLEFINQSQTLHTVHLHLNMEDKTLSPILLNTNIWKLVFQARPINRSIRKLVILEDQQLSPDQSERDSPLKNGHRSRTYQFNLVDDNNNNNNFVHLLFYSECNQLLLKSISYKLSQCYPWSDNQYSIKVTNLSNDNQNIIYQIYNDNQCQTINSTITFISGQCDPNYSMVLQLSSQPIIPQTNTLYYERYISDCDDSNDSRIRYSLADGVCIQDELIFDGQIRDYQKVVTESLLSLNISQSGNDKSCSNVLSTRTYTASCSAGNNNYHIANAFPVVNQLSISAGLIVLNDYNSFTLESISSVGWNGVNLNYLVYYYDASTNQYQLGCKTNNTCTIDKLSSGAATRLLIKVDGVSYFGVVPSIFTAPINLPAPPQMTSLTSISQSLTSLDIIYFSAGGFPNIPNTYLVTINGQTIDRCADTINCTIDSLPSGSTVNISVVAINNGKQSAALEYQQLLHDPVTITKFDLEFTSNSFSIYYDSKGGLPDKQTTYTILLNGTVVPACNNSPDKSCTITNITEYQDYNIQLIALNDGQATHSQDITIILNDGYIITTETIVAIIFVLVGFIGICGFACFTYRNIYMDNYLYKKIFGSGKKKHKYEYIVLDDDDSEDSDQDERNNLVVNSILPITRVPLNNQESLI